MLRQGRYIRIFTQSISISDVDYSFSVEECDLKTLGTDILSGVEPTNTLLFLSYLCIAALRYCAAQTSTNEKSSDDDDDDDSSWITSCAIKLSEDGISWSSQRVQEVCSDAASEFEINLEEEGITRFVRIEPLTWVNAPALRLELIGTQMEKLDADGQRLHLTGQHHLSLLGYLLTATEIVLKQATKERKKELESHKQSEEQLNEIKKQVHYKILL